MTKLDDLLSKWPMAERPQLESDEAAERVVAAIEGGQLPAAIDEGLLAGPLPKTAEEGQTSAPQSLKPGRAGVGGIAGVESKMAKDRTRDRTSFQELAKMATTPPPPTASVVPPSASSSGKTASASGSGPSAVLRGKEADSSDSGIVDLKMIASADPSGEQRAQSTPLAASGLFEDESAPPKPAMTASAAEQVAAPASSASAPPAAAKAVPQTSARKAVEKKEGGGGVLIVVGGLFAVAAIAAGVFFFVKYQHAHQAAVATNSTAAADTAAAPVKSAAPATTASVASNDIETDEVATTVDTTTGKPVTTHVRVRHHATGVASATPVPEGTVDPKLVANIPTGPAGGGNGDLAAEMKAAANGGTGLGGTGGQQDQGPKFAPGSVAQHPSQGQVTGAIGSVMGAARACLGSDEPVSHATITFQSDGTVKSVSVTGFASGKPQEACIKTALSKAKVDPFAEATYPATISIRPN